VIVGDVAQELAVAEVRIGIVDVGELDGCWCREAEDLDEAPRDLRRRGLAAAAALAAGHRQEQ
jgi:hypothetical protein